MGIIRNTVIAVIGAMVTFTGAANADTQNDRDNRAQAADPAVSAAVSAQRAHDQLQMAFHGRDFEAMRVSVVGIDGMLDALTGATPAGTTGGQARTVQTGVVEADQLNQRLTSELATLNQQRQLPGMPVPLDGITSLVDSLLSTLLGLVTSLLGGAGGGAAPVPDLPVGDLPVPELPAPGLPAPPAPPVP